MVIGLIPVVIGAYFLIFPAGSAGPGYLFIWASVMYLGWNAIRTPYRAWGAELAPDYDFRTDVAGMREMMGLLGFVAAIAIPVIFADNQVAPSWAPRTSLMMIAMFVSILALLPLATAICLARVESRDPEPVRRRYPIRAAFREFMANRPFGRFLIAATLTALAHGITASLFLLLVRHVLSRPDQGARYLALTFAAAALTIPVAAFLSRKKSKHRAWGWLLCLSAAGLMFTPVLGAGGTTMMVVICAAIGVGLGADLALGYAVLADVVDYDRLRSGERRAGAYFGLTGFAAKAAAAIAVALSFTWLAAIGFEPGAQAPAPGQILLFAIFYGGAPALCRFIAAIVIWDFRPGRFKHADIEKALRKRARRRIKRRKPQRPTPAQRRTARKKAARLKAAARKAVRTRATAKTKPPRKRSKSAKAAGPQSARKAGKRSSAGKAPKKTRI